jgi:hypothetical protein
VTKPKAFRSKSGRVLSDAEIEAIASEVSTTDYDVADLTARRRGRPVMGSGPAEVVPVRLDPELRRAVEARAGEDHTTTSDVIRRALRDFLHVS